MASLPTEPHSSSESVFGLEKRSLKALSRILSSVLNNADGTYGAIITHSSSFWEHGFPGLVPEDKNVPSDDASSTRKSLNDLEAAQSALEGLSAFLRDGIKILQQKHTVLVSRTYVAFAPDDVLSKIFAYILTGVEGDAKGTAPFNLSRVSSQYRRVALASSKLWTHISNAQHPDMVTAFLSRSKDAGVHVVVDSQYNLNSSSNSHISYWDKIKEVSDRLKSLKVTASKGKKDVDALSDFWDTTLNAPSLEEIQICSPGLTYLDFFDDCQWDVPNIRSLVLRGVIPRGTQRFASFASIRSFDISLLPNEPSTISTNSLFPSLANLQVEDLSLRISDVGLRGSYELASLHSVRKLRLELTILDSNSLYSLFMTFETPNITELTCVLNAQDESDVQANLHIIFSDTCLALETLNLKIETECLSEQIFYPIAIAFPNLRHLFFDSCQSDIFSKVFNGHYLQLKTIRLENCDFRNSGFIHALLESMGDPDALEKFEIIGCKGFDDGMFKGRIGVEKLVWS